MENTISTWLIPILTALIGGVIGTFLGAWLVSWFQDKKLNGVRKIAIKALELFEKYDKKSFRDASNEFNTTLNISEKQMVLVALHKIGLPIDIAGEDVFNINSVRFLDRKIEKEMIEGMVLQIKKKYCDRFFFPMFRIILSQTIEYMH